MGLIHSAVAHIEAAAGAVGVSVLAALFREDAAELADRVANCTMARAVKRLPECLHERYREEWASHIRETRGVLHKLSASSHMRMAARDIGCKHQADMRAWVSELLSAWEDTCERQTALVARTSCMERHAILLEWGNTFMQSQVLAVMERKPGMNAAERAGLCSPANLAAMLARVGEARASVLKARENVERAL